MNSQRSCGCLVLRSWEEKGSSGPKEGLLSDTAVRGGEDERKLRARRGRSSHPHLLIKLCVEGVCVRENGPSMENNPDCGYSLLCVSPGSLPGVWRASGNSYF